MPLLPNLLAISLLLIPTVHASELVPPPPVVDAEGWLLIDFDSGAVLAEQRADTPLEPASLTKIMTAHVVFSEIKRGSIALEDSVRISKKAWKTPGSRMFVEVGTRVSVEELLHGLIIQSGNDAGVALAEHVAGSEETFAQLMNSHASRLGMTASHFANSTGLPHPDHYTTARDIARVTAATIRDFPEFYPWYAIKEYTYGGIRQTNRNLLLWRDPSVDGVKTGHTEAAGYCLVASAQRNGMRLISVVLGTESAEARSRESRALLDYGFRFYETYRLYEGGQALKRQRIWQGVSEHLDIGLAEGLMVTIPRGQFKNIQSRLELPTTLAAPVARGATVGRLRVSVTGVGEVATRPLIALQGVAKGSLWQQARDGVLRYFE